MKKLTNHSEKTRMLVRAALFVALIFVATLLHVNIGPSGYVHLGDSFTLLSALLLPMPWAAGAAGLGSAMADVVSGWPMYSPFTFVIKALMAITAYVILRHVSSTKRLLWAAGAGAVILVVGYFFSDAMVLADYKWPNLPANVLQAIAGQSVGVVLCLFVNKDRAF